MFSRNQLRQLKDKIDREDEFFFKYFFTGTWSPRELVKMRNSVIKRAPELTDSEVDTEVQIWRIKQVQRFHINVAKGFNSHLKSFWAINPDHEHEHFHTLILSQNKLLKGKMRPLWVYGEQTHWAEYDPEYGERNFGNPDRNCVSYIFGKHIAIPNESGVFCPGKGRNCRSGECNWRQRIHYK